MNTICWRMNATQGGVNLHPGVNLLPGANLHPGANCAHEHGLRRVKRGIKSRFGIKLVKGDMFQYPAVWFEFLCRPSHLLC